jgi:hypothetical protein
MILEEHKTLMQVTFIELKWKHTAWHTNVYTIDFDGKKQWVAEIRCVQFCIRRICIYFTFNVTPI